MSSSRQPLLTLSPSHIHISSSNRESPHKNVKSSSQTTPTLPRRERLASFSRLLKNEKFAEFTRNLKKPADDTKRENTSNFSLGSSINIHVSPCSPSKQNVSLHSDDSFLKPEKRYFSPNHLPFSPRLLKNRSPIHLSPDYRHPSPLRSPLYKPDNQRDFLGRGSFGKVSLMKYKGSHLAVKIAHRHSLSVGEKNLLGIRHPHLVEIYHVSEVLDETLIFMEFAGHCNLQQILDTKSELDIRRKLSFCAQIASGLRHCHQHLIVHGDLKPANVIVSPLGICKLGDFGHSINLAMLDTNKLCKPSQDIVGTAAYAAPEILRGSCPTPASDMYSFGILLWQVETREIPFAGEHPHVIIYKVANYGDRPKFSNNSSPIMTLYIKTADSCCRTVPEERIDASHALWNIQDIMQQIKESK